MKKTIKYFAALAASLLAFACTQEMPTPDKNGLPSATSLHVNIVEDQETNYVTFSIQETGVVPMWIFGDDALIDGKKNKKYAYTGNGITLRIREAGIHEVEVKAYNKNGVSISSQIATFELKNTYRDPFDPMPTLKKLATTWVWNADEAGHFGCGEPGTEGLNWWSAGPQEKAAFSLYDDQMTFTVDGQYTYDPVDGQTYVNWNCGYHSELWSGVENDDYVAPIEGFTHPFTLEQTFNNAGIEEIYLVLQEGDNLSYIASGDQLSNPRYKIASLSAKKVDFIFDNGGIAWHYQFVPFVKKATPQELLAGTDENGKAWIMDFETPGHLGCGPGLEDPTSWWAAAPGDKSDTGLADDELTFYPDGTYEFNSGADGMTYINTGVKVVGAEYWKDADFDMPWPSFKSTYEFDGENITLPEGMILGYLPNDAAYNEPKYVVTELTETKLVFVCVSDGGIGWQYIYKARDIAGPSESLGGVEFAGGKVELEISNGEELAVEGIDLASYWIDPDFFKQIDAKTLKFVGPTGEYTILNMTGDKPWFKAIPTVGGSPANWDNGKQIWIIGINAGKPEGGQPGWDQGIYLDLPFVKTGENTYQITLFCQETADFKVFGQAGWGKEWLTSNYSSISGGILETRADDGNLHMCAGVEAGWYTLKITDTDGEGLFELVVEPAEAIEKPFILGEPVDLSDVNMAFLAGSWTWEAATPGHMGCGESVANPTNWWSAAPGDKAPCHLYDDIMSFTADGKYTYDPVDGMTYMNTGVTKMDAAKVEQAGGDDWVVNVSKQENVEYELDKSGEYPVISFPAGTIFSYIPNDAFLNAPALHITAAWENQIELAANTDPGIAWRYRLKKIK